MIIFYVKRYIICFVYIFCDLNILNLSYFCNVLYNISKSIIKFVFDIKINIIDLYYMNNKLKYIKFCDEEKDLSIFFKYW